MKNTQPPVSVTSIPQAPHDENRARVRSYVIMMGIRMACFVLAVLITPYGWHTLLFCLGAIFLPYFAVVLANVDGRPAGTPAESPSAAIDAPAAAPESAPRQEPTVIRISESSPSDEKSGS